MHEIVREVQRQLDARFAALRKNGVVTSVNVVDHRIQVQVEGASMMLLYLSSYSPTLNDKVLVDCVDRNSWIILGKAA